MTRKVSQQSGQAGTTDVVVIGAGHCGLAVSHCLNERGIPHVVLERGEVANSWRHERWDSLTLLTQNWQTNLPGFAYDGDDPEGFMTMPEVVSFMEAYARHSGAPVQTRTTVKSVKPVQDGYQVMTDRGEWRTRAVVVASGACNVAKRPAIANHAPEDITSLTPLDYRNPDQLNDGGVLVVGASATGLQLAEEFLHAGHPVTIAAGEHVRMPRHYRGRDIQYWLDCAGVLEESWQDVDDLTRARHLPSPQLIGSAEHPIFDLNHLTRQGAQLLGRLMDFRGDTALFSGTLYNVCQLADLKMGRLLDQLDEWIDEHAVNCAPAERFEPTRVGDDPPLTLNLRAEGIRTIFWATGFHPDYHWLDMSIFDRKGLIRHDGGVAEAPGLYVLGMPMLRRRKSSFIHGAADDARDITEHLAGFLDSSPGTAHRAA